MESQKEAENVSPQTQLKPSSPELLEEFHTLCGHYGEHLWKGIEYWKNTHSLPEYPEYGVNLVTKALFHLGCRIAKAQEEGTI